MFLCLVLNKKSQLAYIRPLESVGWFLLWQDLLIRLAEWKICQSYFLFRASEWKFWYSYCLITYSYLLIGVSEIPRAHARNHKVFYPCNRCHLATLLENQCVTCGNEVTRVTTNGDFALIFIQHSYYVHQNTACGLRRYPNSVFHPMEQNVPPHGTNRKVPPPRVEGAAFKGRRYGLHRRNKKLYKLIWCFPRIMLSLQKVLFL